jgi:hypothetical protein
MASGCPGRRRASSLRTAPARSVTLETLDPFAKLRDLAFDEPVESIEYASDQDTQLARLLPVLANFVALLANLVALRANLVALLANVSVLRANLVVLRANLSVLRANLIVLPFDRLCHRRDICDQLVDVRREAFLAARELVHVSGETRLSAREVLDERFEADHGRERRAARFSGQD